MEHQLTGRLDEHTTLPAVKADDVLDLGGLTRVTSRGVLAWRNFIESLGFPLKVRRLPEALVGPMSTLPGMLKGLSVVSFLAAMQCGLCHEESTREASPEDLYTGHGFCPSCGGMTQFSGQRDDYEALLKLLQRYGRS